MSKRVMRQLLINTLICGFLFALLNYLHYVKPHIYVYLVTEDWLGEYASFSCYFFAFLILSYLIFKGREKIKWGYILIALMCGFIAMEEISWGQRLLGFSTPSVIAKFNAQSEVNIHNILFLYFPLSKFFCVIICLWVLGFPLLSIKFEKFKLWVEKWDIPTVPISQCPYFKLGVALFFCKGLVERYEMGELFLGMAFLLWTMTILWQVLESNPKTNRIRFHFVILISVSLVFVTNNLTFANSDRKQLQWRFTRSASVQYPKRGHYAQALKLFEYLTQHPELWTEGTMLHYGLLLMKTNNHKADSIFHVALNEEYRHLKEEPFKPVHTRNIAIISRALGKIQESNNQFQRALELDRIRFKKATQDWERVTALKSMAKTFYEKRDIQSALNSLFEARLYANKDQRLKTNIYEMIAKYEKELAN